MINFLSKNNILEKFRSFGKTEKLEKQIPDTLEALANAMKAGYSLNQALEFITRESVEPIKTPLDYAVSKMQYSFSTEEMLNSLKDKANSKDIDMVVNGILLQFDIGGNIIEMLENMSEIMRERIKLKNEMKAMTAQGRFSGILIATLCPVSLIMFYFLSPQYIELLFFTSPGQLMLLTAIILEIVGFKLILDITRLKI